VCKNGVNCKYLGEISASGYNASHQYVTDLELGKMKQIIIDCDYGLIISTGFGDFVLAILADAKSTLGLLKCIIDSVEDKLITAA